MTEKGPLEILVVDDEDLARQGLVRMLQNVNDHIDFDVKVVGEAANGREALKLSRSLKPDIVFLDISMPGMNGLDVVDLMAEKSIQVIFVTAHDEFAVAAFDREVVDYVLKPFGISRIIKSIERARDRLASRVQIDRAALLDREPEGPTTRFLAKKSDKVCLVSVDDIIALESNSNYVLLHTKENSFTIRGTLSQLAEKLDPHRFVRSHRSYVIRIDAIEEMAKTGSGDVSLKLVDGTSFPLSRTYRAEFEKRVGRIP